MSIAAVRAHWRCVAEAEQVGAEEVSQRNVLHPDPPSAARLVITRLPHDLSSTQLRRKKGEVRADWGSECRYLYSLQLQELISESITTLGLKTATNALNLVCIQHSSEQFSRFISSLLMVSEPPMTPHTFFVTL